MTIHKIKQQGAQGDVLFIRVGDAETNEERAKLIPSTAQMEERNGDIVLAHSETGHNHSIHAGTDAHLFREPSDPLTCYLMINDDHADVIHHRSFDTHAPQRLEKGVWKVRRQRESTPQGWRKIED